MTVGSASRLSRSVKRPWKCRTHGVSLRRFVHVRARTSTELVHFLLHVGISESSVLNRETPVELKFVDDVASAGRDDELRCKVEDAVHRRARRGYRQTHDVFESSVVDGEIQLDHSAIPRRFLIHAASRRDRRIQKRRIDGIECRIAVRGVDEGVVRRVRVAGVAARADREIGRFGLAGDVDPVERPAGNFPQPTECPRCR